jgi:hypothetical protein
MKKWMVPLILIAAGWFWWGRTPSPAQLKPVAYQSGGRIGHLTSDRIGSIKDLRFQATDTAYSVISISSDSCPYCRELEPKLSRFTQVRSDVQLKIITLPSPPPQCLGAMDSAQYAQCEPQLDAVQAEYKRIGVCHTPHIAIYDPAGKPIAEDSCNGRKGLDFLHQWLREEGAA